MTTKTYPVKDAVKAKSYIKGMAQYQEMYQKSVNEPEAFWLDVTKNIDWFQFPTKAKQGDFTNVNHAWYMGGKLNASFNCLDRHLDKRGDKPALI